MPPGPAERAAPVIRAFLPDDMPGLESLWIAAWQATMPAIDFSARGEWLRARIAAHRAAGVLVLVAAEPAPAGFVTIDRASGHLDQLAVRLDRRGSGLAASLLDAAKRASSAGVHLEVNQENPRAVAFYRREGFAIEAAGTIGPTARPTWLMRWLA